LGLAAALGPLLIVGAKVIAIFLQIKILAAAVGVGISAIAAPVAGAVAVVGGLAAVFLKLATNAEKAKAATREAAAAAEQARQIRLQTPEGRERELRRLEERRAWLLRRVAETRESIR